MKLLSNINMFFAAVLLLFVFLFGPTMRILADFGTGLVTYVQDVVPLSNPFGREDDSFRESWTSFYWAWWISWSPFVGMLIARVSRGRTVREFITCVILIPSLVSVFWMAVFGGTAIDQVIQQGQQSGVYEDVIANYDASIAMFAMLGELPLTSVLSTLAIILVLVVLHHLVGFRITGHRHDHRRRQDLGTDLATDLLGDDERDRGHRVAGRRWPDRAGRRW